MTKVIVAGALGRMGRETITALANDPDLELVGGVAPRPGEGRLSVPGGSIPLSSDLEALIAEAQPRVMVDFTNPHVVMENVRIALKHKVSPVIGTSGITPDGLAEIEDLAARAGVGAVVAPNFAVGVNLMMHFARIAAKFMSAAEIIELHHDKKMDAPSGTAVATAREMVAARGSDFDEATTTTLLMDGARGGVEGGIHVHSVRLPGLVAHQEIIFGGLGQILTLRHDSISRESFMPGVILAVKEVTKRSGLVNGLDRLMGLA